MPGIWLGINERTEEVLVGTSNGVVKCRTVNRMSEDNRWDAKMVTQMRGLPWEPVPGKPGIPVPVGIRDDGTVADGQDTEEARKVTIDEEEGEEVKFKGGPDRLHISRKAIERYGPTAGCPACTAIERQKHLRNPIGRFGHNHNETCRERIKDFMRDDPQYRQLLQRHRQSSGSNELANLTQGDSDIDVMSQDYYEERRGHVEKALHMVKQKMQRSRMQDVSTQLDQMMLQMLIMNMDIAEFYSPPRVAKMARDIGLRAGWSLDLTTNDSDGRAWDFNDVEMRKRAVRKVFEDKPLLLIGSPMCTIYSSMNQINHARMSPEEVEERFRYARRHLEFSTKLYKIQIEVGRYFLHEHPHTASSWYETCIQQILKKEGVMHVVGDQCMYGPKTTCNGQEGPARKRIGFMTNSVCIAQQFQRRCPNTANQVIHKHIVLEDGRTRKAQIYPREVCRAICEGLQKQIQADTMGQFLLLEIDSKNATSDSLMNVAEELKAKYQIVEEPENPELDIVWDDVSGAELVPAGVKKARAEEVEYIRKIRLYEKVLVEQCYQRIDKAPITIRWIDINKGDVQSPNYRSRLVAREINTHKRDDLFAATPSIRSTKDDNVHDSHSQ